jgi:hypothetical protein
MSQARDDTSVREVPIRRAIRHRCPVVLKMMSSKSCAQQMIVNVEPRLLQMPVSRVITRLKPVCALVVVERSGVCAG